MTPLQGGRDLLNLAGPRQARERRRRGVDERAVALAEKPRCPEFSPLLFDLPAQRSIACGLRLEKELTRCLSSTEGSSSSAFFEVTGHARFSKAWSFSL